MKQRSGEILEHLLKTNGLGWVIERFSPPDMAVPTYLEKIEKAAADYQIRVKAVAPFLPEGLKDEQERNPHKVLAFLQALRFVHSPEMLVMVWRILQGLTIRDVRLNYHLRESFQLRIDLMLPGTDVEETFQSQHIHDAVLLRHLGVSLINGKPLYEGFFALRVQ